MRSLIKSKKGQLGDTFVIMGSLLAFDIVIVLCYFISSSMKPELDTALNQTTITTQTTDSLKTFDIMFPLVLLGLLIFSVISAFYISSHPAFFFIGIFLIVIAIIAAVAFENMYSQFRDSPEIIAYSADFPITNWIINKLPFLAVIISIIIMVAVFAKPAGTGGGGI